MSVLKHIHVSLSDVIVCLHRSHAPCSASIMLDKNVTMLTSEPYHHKMRTKTYINNILGLVENLFISSIVKGNLSA